MKGDRGWDGLEDGNCWRVELAGRVGLWNVGRRRGEMGEGWREVGVLPWRLSLM